MPKRTEMALSVPFLPCRWTYSPSLPAHTDLAISRGHCWKWQHEAESLMMEISITGLNRLFTKRLWPHCHTLLCQIRGSVPLCPHHQLFIMFFLKQLVALMVSVHWLLRTFQGIDALDRLHQTTGEMYTNRSIKAVLHGSPSLCQTWKKEP